MKKNFLHDDPEWESLLRIVSSEQDIPGSPGKELNYSDYSFRNAEITITYLTYFHISENKEDRGSSKSR